MYVYTVVSQQEPKELLTIINALIVSGSLALATESQVCSLPSRQGDLPTIDCILHDFDKHSHDGIVDGNLSVHIANIGSVTCYVIV